MFGFLLGAACLGGLIALTAHRRRAHGFGRHCGAMHRFGSRWGASCSGGRYLLQALLERLDTTPGQEKVIVAAVQELRETARELRSRLSGSREQLAHALRSDTFDERAVQTLILKHNEDLGALGTAASSALGKVHEALDAEQRQRLARWVESGPGFGFA